MATLEPERKEKKNVCRILLLVGAGQQTVDLKEKVNERPHVGRVLRVFWSQKKSKVRQLTETVCWKTDRLSIKEKLHTKFFQHTTASTEDSALTSPDPLGASLGGVSCTATLGAPLLPDVPGFTITLVPVAAEAEVLVLIDPSEGSVDAGTTSAGR